MAPKGAFFFWGGGGPHELRKRLSRTGLAGITSFMEVRSGTITYYSRYQNRTSSSFRRLRYL